MEHLLFAAYLILFSWLVTKVPFFKKSGLTSAQLIILFLVRVIASIIYGWVGVYYGNLAQMVDTWAFHYQSLQAHELLKQSPTDYFHYLFGNGYDGYGNFLSSYNSWWNDLHNNAFTMLVSLFHFLSFGNYYINGIFFAFLSFFGPVALYLVLLHAFPTRKLPVLIATFLLPSLLYWTSGIHKDGIVFIAFMLIIYNVYFGLKKGFTITKILCILAGLLLLLIIRNYLLLLIVPAMLVWILAEKIGRKTALVFSASYLLFFICFFTAKLFHQSLDFPAAVVNKQADFKKLKGGSFVPTHDLKPEFISFLENAPEAFTLSTLRPYPSDVQHLLSLAASVEINIILLCFVLFLFCRKKGLMLDKAFLYFCVFFALSALLTIGYTVNFLGAIVRYRSIVLPFIVTPMVAMIDWKRIIQFTGEKH